MTDRYVDIIRIIKSVYAVRTRICETHLYQFDFFS